MTVVGNNTLAGLPALGAPASAAKFAGALNGATGLFNIDDLVAYAGTKLSGYLTTGVKPENYGAAANGTTDDTGAIQACVAAAKISGSFVYLGGVYAVGGQLNLEGVTFVGPGAYSRAAANYFNQPGTLLFTNTSLTPLLVSGRDGVRFNGVIFAYPNQTGLTVNPIVYPPMIAAGTGAYLTDIVFDNCTVVNTYIFMATQPGIASAGAITISDSNIYSLYFL